MSLRRSLIAGLSALLTIISLLSALVTFKTVQSEAQVVLDLQQQTIARFVGDGSGVASPDGAMPPHDADDDYAIDVSFPDGRPRIRSNPAVTLPSDSPAGFSEFSDARGTSWRLFTLKDPDRTVRVAQETEERDEFAATSALNTAIPILLAIPLSWLLVYGLVAKIMQRLQRLADDVGRRGPMDAKPIPPEEAPLEARPLIVATNRAFERLGSALKQQQTFVSDAAHELRTPLAALALQIDNLRRANEDPALEGQIDVLRGGVQRASAVTGQLLRLATQEARPAGAAWTIVSLNDVVMQAVATLAPLAADRGVDLGLADFAPVTIRGAEQDLCVLCETLIDNAARYTPAGGMVDVSLVAEGGRATLVVQDSGPGVPESMLPRVFDRFFRGEATDVAGSGLGLSIAKVIADRHGATLALSNRADRSGLIARATFARVTAPV